MKNEGWKRLTMETTQMLATNLATLQSSFHSTVAQHGMPRNQR